MPASPDTVLRLVRRMPLPARRAPRVLGVDDWARRKGRTYGTILVDLERRRVADLLPDRSATTLAAWLRRRPTIEVIARDRSTEYGRGAAMGAPKATQVADHWHRCSTPGSWSSGGWPGRTYSSDACRPSLSLASGRCGALMPTLAPGRKRPPALSTATNAP
jgi:transposase